jgi:WXG100 family type VII secretion target
MAGDGLIRYDHEALRETVQHMLNANNQISQQMEDLESQVMQNKELFLGDASDQYGVNAKQIGNDLMQSTERLQGVANSVGVGAGDIADTDRRLAQLFQ